MDEMRELQDRVVALEAIVKSQEETIRTYFIYRSDKSQIRVPTVRLGKLSKTSVGASILFGGVSVIRFLLDMFLA